MVTKAGDYFVKAISPGGCVTYSDTVTIVVHPLPIVIISATSPEVPDSGGIDTLTLTEKYASVIWSTGASADTIFVTDSGTYRVSVVDSNGCSGNASIFINRGIGPPSITVSLDTLEGAPCDHIVFPIRIDTSKNMPPSGATDYVAVITFNESLLAPVDNSIPSVIIDSANHRWRTITLRGVRPDERPRARPTPRSGH